VSPDAELCDATYCQLEVAGEEPTDEVYTTIVLAWAASNAINNGGFEFLFEGAYFQRDPRYARTLAAYERIGASACAGATRDAIAWLGSSPPADQVQRMARVQAVPKDERGRVACAFYAGKAELERHLADYIRAHAAELEARPPGEHRFGDLRLAGPRRLQQLRDDGEVAATYDLSEWKPDVCSARRDSTWCARFAMLAVVLAALGLWATGFVARFLCFLAAGGAAHLAVFAYQVRLWLVLRRGAEEVWLGDWARDDLLAMSFASGIVVSTRLRASEIGDDDRPSATTPNAG
jgi:hypothetical protein